MKCAVRAQPFPDVTQSAPSRPRPAASSVHASDWNYYFITVGPEAEITVTLSVLLTLGLAQ